MTQEEYLQLKKEYKIRLVLVLVLFVLFSILSILLIINLNRFIPLGATAMATVVPFNHFLLVPLWEEKKRLKQSMLNERTLVQAELGFLRQKRVNGT